ncbi:transcriptional regulator [Geomonas sp. RF6]|uniref:helix-turn-helix transcriptional regulator n=1 Tax=Geomonas sp. RF6 TaxID=2897342 RepID=UPI001E4735A4|nr:transcriptional regulator [Geomonas sp. RF6]UFS68856.1 transcriptional regulator [Geomonas sp. RF6]
MPRKGRPSKKYSQAARVHDIIRLIEARHGVSLTELEEETGVGRRTIQRDLIAIQEAGYPLTFDWEEGEKLFRFITGFKDVPPISFSLQELMTLSLIRSQIDFLEGTPFAEDVATVFRKVNSVLPPRFAAHMERIAKVAHPLLQGRRDYSKCHDALESIRQALLFQQSIVISYLPAGRGEAANYRVDPYTVLFQKGGLYLLGFAHNRQALRTFALERICGVEVLKERFEIPEDFTPEQALQTAFGLVAEPIMEVKVRFSPGIAHAVRDRVWHPSQEVAAQEDGSVVLTFRAGGRMEILSWILSYGAHAELLAPHDLRQELAAMARQTCALYDGA